MSEPLIVLYLHTTQPPAAFAATPAMLIEHAQELASHTATHPGAPPPLDFPSAWHILSRDKKAAFHFEDVPTARRYVEDAKGFTLYERVALLSLIARLESPGSQPAQSSSA